MVIMDSFTQDRSGTATESTEAFHNEEIFSYTPRSTNCDETTEVSQYNVSCADIANHIDHQTTKSKQTADWPSEPPSEPPSLPAKATPVASANPNAAAMATYFSDINITDEGEMFTCMGSCRSCPNQSHACLAQPVEVI
jgi:hypothetical protein